MGILGNILMEARKKRNHTLAGVALDLNIDTGLISKYENNKRKVSKTLLYTFIQYYGLNEKEVLIAWMSDKIVYEIGEESLALDAMKVAESQIRYNVKSNLSNDVEALLKEVDTLKLKWQKSRPLDLTQLTKMKEYFELNYTFESNRIEGNTLTLQETFLVIKDGLTVGGKSLNEHLEAINHSEAIDYLAEMVRQNSVFTERILQEIHYLVLKGIDRRNAGKYRSVPVYISGSAHKPPQPFLITREMEMIFEFYRENHFKLHPVILAAEMHERIVSVHPFIDGNGRTSRLVMNLILLMAGFTVAIIKGDNDSRMEYYQALESCREKNDKSDFYNLVAKYCKSSLEEHLELAG